MLKLIIPCYNTEDYIPACIRSIKQQSHSEFTAAIVNNASTDLTSSSAIRAMGGDARFSLLNRPGNMGDLSAIYKGISYLSPQPEDIIAIIDGDDYLLSNDALSIVWATYERTGCWITYGSLKAASGRDVVPNIGKRYTSKTISSNNFRKAPWIASHLRTFKHGLWQRIKSSDLLDDSGGAWKAAYDMAIMYPMLEMAGERQEAISDFIYAYRDNLRTKDHFTKRDLQLECAREIRSRPPYQAIKNLCSEGETAAIAEQTASTPSKKDHAAPHGLGLPIDKLLSQ
jgi:glycosyltransferase involved in cell wall biosynthesis